MAEDNSVLCGGWGEQNRNFFLSSLDAAGQKIGRKFEDVPNAQEAVDRIMQGRFAYYENIYFLQFLSQNRKVSGHKSNSTNGKFYFNLFFVQQFLAMHAKFSKETKVFSHRTNGKRCTDDGKSKEK